MNRRTEESTNMIGYAVVAVFWAVIALVLGWKGWPECSLAAAACAVVFGLVALHWLGEYQQLQRDAREWQRRYWKELDRVGGFNNNPIEETQSYSPRHR